MSECIAAVTGQATADGSFRARCEDMEEVIKRPRRWGPFGYEPFAYLARGRRLNPAEVLVAVLRTDDVDARVVEA